MPSDAQTPPPHPPSARNKRPDIFLLWLAASAGGAMLGSIIALILFPSAGFARNPVGLFGWHLVGFALSVAVPFALAQWCALARLLGNGAAADRVLLHMWLPVTAAGIAGMLLPLWFEEAASFIVAPWSVVWPMLPGMIFLGIVQGMLIRWLTGIGFSWALHTVIGAAVGAVAGLLAGILASLLLIPLELIWSLVLGAAIGAVQGRLLAARLGADGS